MIWMGDSGTTFSILPHVDTFCSIPPRAAPAARCRKFRRGSFIFEPPFTSFDHLVGAREYGCRDFQAERLRGLEVDHQLELGRRLHWQVSGLLAFEDAVDVAGRAAV